MNLMIHHLMIVKPNHHSKNANNADRLYTYRAEDLIVKDSTPIIKC